MPKFFRNNYLHIIIITLTVLSPKISFSSSQEAFLKIPLHATSISLDPTLEQDFSSLWVSRQVNCQLLRNTSGGIAMEAAESVKFITPTRLDITLKNTISFSDEKSLTADDVIASLYYLKEKRTVLKNALDWIQEIKKINNNELEITLKKPYPQFLHVFSAPNYSIFPKNFITLAKENTHLWNKPISCGAYFVSDNNQQYLDIKPRQQGLPVRFYYLPSGNITSDQARKFDIILLEVKNPKNLNHDFNTVKIFDPFQFLFIPNTKKAPWNNRNARCALLARLDPSNVMAAYGDMVKPAADLIPSGTLGYSSDRNYQQQIREEGNHLALPQKNSFCFSYIQSSIEENIRNEFQAMFSKKFPSVQQKSLLNSINMAKNFQKKGCDGIILALKSNYLDAYEYLLIFSEQEANVSGYYNKQLIDKIENSQKIVQPDVRVGEYRNIINYLRNQCLIYPLFTMPYEIIYVKKNIDPTNIGLGPLNEYLLSNVTKND